MLNDVSMLLPERKKGNLLLTKRHVVVAYQTIPDIVPVFNIERKHIKVCMILHVPDKAKPQWNVILCGVKPNNDVSSLEPLVQFTIQDLPGSKICNSISRIAMGYTSELELSSRELMNEVFKFVPIVESDSGKGFCVSAHRGSKEGLIYFLDGWVFFGFKKPMVLIPVDRIESVSYSAITRVTFDLTIKQFEGQELELSMIDQGDYDLINDYVIANQLNNQSMSEARRAKQQSGVTVRSSSDLPDIKTNSELNLASGQEGDFKEKIEQDADEDEEEDDESYEIASDHDSDSEEDSENSEDSEASEEGEDFEEDSE